MVLIFLLLAGSLSVAPLRSAADAKPSFSERYLQAAWSLQKKIGPGIVSLGMSALAVLSTYKIAGSMGFSSPKQRALTASAFLLGGACSIPYYFVMQSHYELEKLTDTTIDMLCNSKDPEDLKKKWKELYSKLHGKKSINIVAQNSLDKKLVQLLNTALIKCIDNDIYCRVADEEDNFFLDAIKSIIKELYTYLPKQTLRKYGAITLQQFLKQLHETKHSDYIENRIDLIATAIDKLINNHDHGELDLIHAVESLHPPAVKVTLQKLPHNEKSKKIEDALAIIHKALLYDPKGEHSSFDERMLALFDQKSTDNIAEILNILIVEYKKVSHDTPYVLHKIFKKIAPYANTLLIRNMKRCFTTQTVKNIYTEQKTIQETLKYGTCDALEEILTYPETKSSIECFLGSHDVEDIDKLTVLMSYGFPFSICNIVLLKGHNSYMSLVHRLCLFGIPINTLKEYEQRTGINYSVENNYNERLSELVQHYSKDQMGCRLTILTYNIADDKRSYYNKLVFRRWEHSKDHDERVLLAHILKYVFNDPRAHQENLKMLSTELENGKSKGENEIRGTFIQPYTMVENNKSHMANIIHGYLEGSDNNIPAQQTARLNQAPQAIQQPTADPRPLPAHLPGVPGLDLEPENTQAPEEQPLATPNPHNTPRPGDQLDEKHSVNSNPLNTATSCFDAASIPARRSPEEIAQVKRQLRDREEVSAHNLRGGHAHTRAQLRAKKRIES